jgi:hypothetical protein
MLRKLFVMSVIGMMAGTAMASFPNTSESFTFHVAMSSDEFQRQIADVNSQINSILAQYNVSGAGTFVPYHLVAPNRAVATVTSSQFGTTATITVINEGGSKSGPSSSSSITASHTLRNSILSPAAPGENPKERQKSLRTGSFRADIFYNAWEYDTEGGGEGVKGATVGINPTMTFGGESAEFGVTIPIHATIPKDGDATFNLGADASLRIWLGDYMSIGGHGSYMASMFDSGDGKIETTGSINGGPFVSLRIPLGEVGVVSVAGLYEILKPDEGDAFKEIAVAANLGINLGDSAALNIYGIHHKNADPDIDSDYDEVGSELQFGSGTWSFNFGAKTTIGIDDFTSIEGYLGSQWRW